jgi:hypothetical protein
MSLRGDQDRVAAAVVITQAVKNLVEEGMFCGIFLGWWDPVFAGGFAKNGCLDVVFWW